MEKKLLIYGFEKDGEKYKLLKEIAKTYNIESVDVEVEDIGQKVGTLMELPNYKREVAKVDETPDMEFILFSDFEREVLMDYLKDLKLRGLSVPYKSVITETTKDWPFNYLLDHIKEEHLIMNRYTELGKLVKRAQEMLKEKPDEEIQSAIDFAMTINKFNDIDIEIIEERYLKLVKALGEE
ncbi:DUF3783 domain-containing protein [Anaerosphaera multitolerans]|uniref:DUF3783 domain-containing protein n=1 Tax=Anaerosphaera multitolerans TaxID=2487351 RepID=A0A437S6P8_9FIRM|nr:DUF3783 domain-containing protein [Anaerosphaera multitolerans]RVU54695.1 DUF3783 domain-containing protein [Anaerosphaera multitolerans]